MKTSLLLAATMLALAACQPAATPAADAKPPVGAAADAAAAPAAGCDVKVSRTWGPPGPSDLGSYHVEAWTSGSACESSVTTLAVRQRDGFPIYAWASATQYLFLLSDVKTAAEMTPALTEWLGDSARPSDMTSSLPPWEQTDGQAKPDEFPFMPREGMTKEEYDQLRKDDVHMLCFPQGMESQQCLALYPGAYDQPPLIDEIGLWRFPG